MGFLQEEQRNRRRVYSGKQGKRGSSRAKYRRIVHETHGCNRETSEQAAPARRHPSTRRIPFPTPDPSPWLSAVWRVGWRRDHFRWRVLPDHPGGSGERRSRASKCRRGRRRSCQHMVGREQGILISAFPYSFPGGFLPCAAEAEAVAEV